MNFLESIAETQELVSLPTVAAKVLTMLDKDDVDVREIAKHIESDASMTMKILRLANSPMFALRSEVSSINQAILTVGLNRVTNIVLGVSIFSKFVYLSRSNAAQFMDKFWSHSAGTAALAKSLTSKIKKSFKDAEFLGGLIHDIGKLAMLQHDASAFSEVLNDIQAGSNEFEAERKHFGATHNEAGAVIVKMWKLPNELLSVVQHHNQPDFSGDHMGISSVIRFSDILCENWGAGINEGSQIENPFDDISWKTLESIYPELLSLDKQALEADLKAEFDIHASSLKSLLSN